jgi:hypothetical protein
MAKSRELKALLAAVVIVLVGVGIGMYIQTFNTTKSTRVEEPYVRTDALPPDAVQDKNAAPALKDNKPANPQGQ